MQFLESLLPAHFTRRNRVIFFLALLFSFFSLVALFKVAPKDETQVRKMLATLVDQEHYVTRKFSNSLSFIEVDKGDKLFNGDQIFTGDKSSAKVVFSKSGNVLNIPPKGLVKIEEGQSGENVDIQKGLAEFVIQKGQSMNITQGNETITLQTGADEVGTGKIFFNDNKMILQVDSGKIRLNDGAGKVQELNKFETVSLEGENIKKVIGVGLISPVRGQQIDIWKGLSVEWSSKTGIEMILAKDNSFKEIVGRVNAPTSPYMWNLPLQEGRYYFRVLPVGSKTMEGVTFPLVMVSPHMIKDFLPIDQTTLSLKRGEAVKFSWSAVPAIAYKVTIVDQNGGNATHKTELPELILNDLKGTSIDWSVAPQLASGIFLADSVKNRLNFNFEGENKILMPKDHQNFIFGKDKVALAWTSSQDENMTIKITNLTKNEVVYSKDTQDNKLEFSPEAPGEYVFEVASKDYPGSVASKVNFFAISRIAEWDLQNQVELSSIDPEEKKVELKFTPAIPDLNDIEVSIYSDENLKNKISSSKVLSKTILYKVKKFGNYCFVLRAMNTTSVWKPSKTKCIYYKEVAPFDTIASANNIILKYAKVNGIGSYLINLPLVERASIYEVQVFNGKKDIVFSDKSKSNVITWPSRKTGIFYYRYRVVDSKGRQSAYSRFSKLIFPISPLTEWRE